jgi:transcriptional regulator with XRE-family HTH domain
MLSSKKIIELRNKYGYSQEDIASRLNMSRPTFAKIESGEKKINKIEEEKIREIFSFYEDIKDRADKNIRIDLPKKDIKKFKEILLYILEKVGAEPNVGMTVIYKLLYFIDFDYYEKYEKQIMGLTYFKNNFGTLLIFSE